MALTVLPRDEHNAELVRNVHPPDWRNPEPAERYHLVVVGAGTAGLITALVASSLGARVALVERHLMGGDCLNVGCVPSKALIREARRVAEARSAAGLGLPVPEGWLPDFGEAMRRMRARRARISHEDSARRYSDEFGIDVFLGDARFTERDVVAVDGVPLRFRKAAVATGARPAAPPVPGLSEAGFLTNETVFELTQRPARLAVIGGGPIGCELAQAFAYLGSRVTLFSDVDRLLPREDRDAAEILEGALRREGVELVLGCRITSVGKQDVGKRITYEMGGRAREQGRSPRSEPEASEVQQMDVDEVLVAVGRAPNVEGLGLESAGVAYDARRGIEVDDRLRTSNPRIFAAGDCCMDWKFTHAAEAAAKIVVQNALFLGRRKLSGLVMPWCTYTHPEIAHVGLHAHEAEARGIAVDTYVVPLARVNRAVTDAAAEGFVKVHVRQGRDTILGATIVAADAGNLISEVTTAMVGGLGLGTFTNVIHPYPTQAEGIKAAGGQYTRTRLTPTVKRLFSAWLRLTG